MGLPMGFKNAWARQPPIARRSQAAAEGFAGRARGFAQASVVGGQATPWDPNALREVLPEGRQVVATSASKRVASWLL